MVVAVQEGILDVAIAPILAPPRRAHPVRLETGLLKNDIQPPLCRVLRGDMRLNREHQGISVLHERVVCLLLHFSRFARRERSSRSHVAFRVREDGRVKVRGR